MKNKVVIITGASSGIGKALAFELGQAGAKIVITGRNSSRLAPVAEQLAQKGIDHLVVKADASQEKDNEQMVQQTIDKYGQVDVLINNAGISMRALFEDLQLDTFKQVMDINFMGTVYATKYALPHILATKGSIVGISSINGHRGTPARTAYTASKHAMNGFFEALRTEVMHRGVNVLVVSPGFTESNIRKNALTANGASQGESPRNESQMMSAEAVAGAVHQAIVKKKRLIVLTRLGKLAVWLNKWAPGFMDGRVYQEMAKEPDSPFK